MENKNGAGLNNNVCAPLMKWGICGANCCAISCWLLVYTLSVALGQQLIIIIIIIFVREFWFFRYLYVVVVHIMRPAKEMRRNAHNLCCEGAEPASVEITLQRVEWSGGGIKKHID